MISIPQLGSDCSLRAGQRSATAVCRERGREREGERERKCEQQYFSCVHDVSSYSKQIVKLPTKQS